MILASQGSRLGRECRPFLRDELQASYGSPYLPIGARVLYTEIPGRLFLRIEIWVAP
ncbi:MAG: hypothetical protein ACUVRV_06295 [Cyanobacteriota bacterium]